MEMLQMLQNFYSRGAASASDELRSFILKSQVKDRSRMSNEEREIRCVLEVRVELLGRDTEFQAEITNIRSFILYSKMRSQS